MLTNPSTSRDLLSYQCPQRTTSSQCFINPEKGMGSRGCFLDSADHKAIKAHCVAMVAANGDTVE